MGSQMAINAVIEQAMAGGSSVRSRSGQVVEQSVQTNTNLLSTRDRSVIKAIKLTTSAGAAFQMTGLSLSLQPNGRHAIFICSKSLILIFTIYYKL